MINTFIKIMQNLFYFEFFFFFFFFFFIFQFEMHCTNKTVEHLNFTVPSTCAFLFNHTTSVKDSATQSTLMRLYSGNSYRTRNRVLWKLSHR